MPRRHAGAVAQPQSSATCSPALSSQPRLSYSMLMDGRESVVGQSEALAYSRPTPVDTFIRTLYALVSTNSVVCNGRPKQFYDPPPSNFSRHRVCMHASVANGRRWSHRVGHLAVSTHAAANELLARSRRRALLTCALGGRLDGCPSRRDGWAASCPSAGVACLQATATSHG